jgi:hypothetical protein
MSDLERVQRFESDDERRPAFGESERIADEATRAVAPPHKVRLSLGVIIARGAMVMILALIAILALSLVIALVAR